MADLFSRSDAVSDEDARLDALVEKASQPSLSALMQRAKDAGHIQAVGTDAAGRAGDLA